MAEAAAAFRAALAKVCGELAWRIVRDGEGATRVMEVTVEGAATEREAQRGRARRRDLAAREDGALRRRPELGPDPRGDRPERRARLDAPGLAAGRRASSLVEDGAPTAYREARRGEGLRAGTGPDRGGPRRREGAGAPPRGRPRARVRLGERRLPELAGRRRGRPLQAARILPNRSTTRRFSPMAGRLSATFLSVTVHRNGRPTAAPRPMDVALVASLVNPVTGEAPRVAGLRVPRVDGGDGRRGEARGRPRAGTGSARSSRSRSPCRTSRSSTCASRSSTRTTSGRSSAR